MVDTVQVLLVEDEWAEIARGDFSGYISNNTEHTLRYRLGEQQPADDDCFGHRLHPQDRVPFTVGDGTSLWARGFSAQSSIALTRGKCGAELVVAGETFPVNQDGLEDTLRRIEKQLRIANVHLSSMSGQCVSSEDVING